MNISRVNFTQDDWLGPRLGICHVATAVIGAVGAVGGGIISGMGAKSAAEEQANAQREGIGATREMFDITRKVLDPYVKMGVQGADTWTSTFGPGTEAYGKMVEDPLAQLLRLTMPGTNMTEALRQTPGYQFQQQMGQMAVNNAMAKRGLGGPGGPLARASADYATGLAESNWRNIVSAAQGGAQAGLGAYTASSTPLLDLTRIGAGAASALGGQATTAGGNLATGYGNIGTAQAAGTVGQASALSGIAGDLGQYGMLANLLRSRAPTPNTGMYGPVNVVGAAGSHPVPTFMAKGGRFRKGQPIVVGEKGPELIVPDEDGVVVPNHALAGLVTYSKPKKRCSHAQRR